MNLSNLEFSRFQGLQENVSITNWGQSVFLQVTPRATFHAFNRFLPFWNKLIFAFYIRFGSILRATPTLTPNTTRTLSKMINSNIVQKLGTCKEI